MNDTLIIPRKPVILALDVSKSKTGWARWDTNRHVAGITTGSFKITEKKLFDAVDAFHIEASKLINETRPDYIAFEEGLPNIPSYESEGSGDGQTEKVVNAHSSLILQRLLGDVQGLCRGNRKPHESVYPVTWRKSFLGYSRRSGFKSPDWKKAAKSQCADLNIQVSNADEAEAVGVAFWCGTQSQHFKLFCAKFEQLQMEARAAA